MLTVSVISPSFNQARYISKTLQSVAGQSIEPCEHIIFDPGSTDGTLELLRDFEQRTRFAKLRIGVDTGQANAINLGFREAKGDILCWLNTDDQYFDGEVFSQIVDIFEREPRTDIVYGRGEFIGPDGSFIRDVFINSIDKYLESKFIHSCGIFQPALFMRRQVFEECGCLDESLGCAFDYEYWIRALKSGARFRFFDRKLAKAVWHDDAKTAKLRGQSFEESLEACRRHYGFAPIEWIERIVGWRKSGENFVVRNAGPIDEAKLGERERLSTAMFEMYNGGSEAPRCISAILKWAHTPDAKRNVRMATRVISAHNRILTTSAIDENELPSLMDEQEIPATDETLPRTWIVTAFDKAYFSLGLTLLSGLFGNGHATTPKLVFDMGLTPSQVDFLRSLDSVYVITLDGEAYGLSSWYFEPKNYVFKLLAIEHTRRIAEKDDIVIWIDAGVYPTSDMAEIIAAIRAENAFFIDHDDRPTWPFFNITFTSDACARAAGSSLGELLSPHICSCLIGFRSGSRFERLFEEAFVLSRNPEISLGEKHPELPDRIPAKSRREVRVARRRLLSKPPKAWDIRELRSTFGYAGHRQDQTILSLLVARAGAPVFSASYFCPGSDSSSNASRKNHMSGGLSKEVRADPHADRTFPDAVTIHHRGTFVSYENLRFRAQRKREAVILGNGPSLKGFDFSRLERFDTFGMNVAYRHWYEINWFPQYYACLDKVVGIHHKDAILRLIQDSETLGIRSFLLRKELIDALGDVGQSPKVMNFDALRGGFAGLRAEPITTGSHACAWASMLGYEDIYLLGVDCNYVALVDGAVPREGTVLEIVEEKENPNYFFAGYQRAGDKYNVPDSSKDLHIRSWRSVGAEIHPTRSRVVNANFKSKVDAFPFADFDEVERGGLVPLIPTAAVLSGDLSADRRSRIIVPSPQTTLEIGKFDRADAAQIDECRIVFELLKNKFDAGVMIDVGAHYGESLRRFAAENWTVFAFEPDPKNRAILADRSKGQSNVILSEEAVSDVSEEVVALYASDESSGISGLSPFHESHREVAQVRTVTLDDVVERHKLSMINFLKVDVEGLEMAVLRGLDFSRLLPDTVLAEFEDSKTLSMGYDVHDLCHFFMDRGYTVYVSEWFPIEKYGVSHSFRRFHRYPSDILAASWGNLLAFRNDPTTESLAQAVRTATTLPDAGVSQTRTVDKKAGRKATGARASTNRRNAGAKAKNQTKRRAKGHAGKRRGKGAHRVQKTDTQYRGLKAARKPGSRRKRGTDGRNPVADFVRTMPIATVVIGIAAFLLLVWAVTPDPQRATEFFDAFAPIALLVVVGAIAYDHLRRRIRKQAFRTSRQSIRRAARQKQETRKVKKLFRGVTESGRKLRQVEQANVSLTAEGEALRNAASEAGTALSRLDRQVKAVTSRLYEVEKQEIPQSRKDAAFLRERVVAGERQIAAIRYPDASPCIAFFGHHKCASRFFRNEVFGRLSEITGAKPREYEIASPPFHYWRMDELDLSNMNFDDIGALGRDIVLFANASGRSLQKLREVAPDWKAIRVVRDPRQVLVSGYFHHKGDHWTESPVGWVWDALERDKPVLLKLPKEEGLLYELDNITKEVIEEQILGPFDDERILTLKLEEFTAAPREHLIRISKFLQIADIAGIDLGNTFANRDTGDWRDHFTPKLKAVFKERYGQALIDLGYERDIDW